MLGTPPAFILSQDQTLRSGAPLRGALSSNQNKEKAIGMMVRSPGSGSLWNWSLVGDLRRPHAGGGPARVPIRLPRYPVFKVPGASSAPPRRFLPSAAQGDMLRAPPPAVKGESRLFPGKGRLRGRFRRTTWGDTLRLPFEPRTHFLHKPRKDAGGAVWGISMCEGGNPPNVPEPN